MALKTFVKVGGITNLSDARYCAGMGVDVLGFCLDADAADFVSPVQFQSLAGWVAGVQLAGEITDADQVNLTTILQQYSLDWLQVSTSSDWAALKQYGISLICKVAWNETDTADWFFEQYSSVAPYVSYFLLEAGQASVSPSQTEIITIAKQFPLLLGFGLESSQILRILSAIPVKGIALKGSSEIRPGYKDFGELAEILEVLETE